MGETHDEGSGLDAALQTARLTLRRFPWDAVCAIVEGGRLDDWAPDYPTEGDGVIAGILHRRGAPLTGASDLPEVVWGHWQVLERGSGLVVGGIGFLDPPVVAEVEIGYGIAPSRRGRGYATEALRAALLYVTAQGSVTAVVAGTDHDNPASRRVLEKAGFRCLGPPDAPRYLFELGP